MKKVSNRNEAASGFQLDLQDDRFAPLLKGDSRYGIDPTSTLFKNTTGMQKILEEQRRISGKDNEISKNRVDADQDNHERIIPRDGSNGKLTNSKSLAEKLKRKFSSL